MNNQSWRVVKLRFMNVFSYGDNKMNTINFDELQGSISIVGPNATGKSNIINILIYVLYGNNKNFRVTHVLNKYQKEYFIECEIILGSTRIKIVKSGKKRKGDKINHTFSFFIFKDRLGETRQGK